MNNDIAILPNLNIFRKSKRPMSNCRLFIVLIALTIGQITAFSQQKKAGPVIENYGEVWNIENPQFKTDTTKVFKVVFDIMDSPQNVSEINKSIETAARFLNMHAQHGVPRTQLKVALVVHNSASKDILDNQGYQKRFSVDNPNKEMIEALLKAEVSFVFCGQSSLSRSYPIEEAIAGVQISLSAMTALIQLQDEGYQLIKF